MNNTSISVESLSKRYRIGLKEELPETLLESMTAWLKTPWVNFKRLRQLSHFGTNSHNQPHDVIWALKDVSFDVAPGEVVGIIGANGAGKSTLLKILSRITEPTSGLAVINGRVSSLLEVGTGFHSDLTGRENVYLNGTILGMSKREIDRKFDEIVDFSGVEKFIDTPVKRYSSGMKVRLAFAVAAHLEPEILMVDEVLAVGDVAFQKKSLGKIGQVAKEGRTVLLVSHSMVAIQRFCKRVLLIDQGTIKQDGIPQEVISRYMRDQLALSWVDLDKRDDRTGSGRIRVAGIRLEDGRGQVIESLQSGEKLKILLSYKVAAIANNVSIEISFYNFSGVAVYRCSTEYLGLELNKLQGQGEIACLIPKLLLPASSYQLNVTAIVGGDCADRIETVATLHVVEGDIIGHGRLQSASEAVALLEHTWELYKPLGSR
jgi:lipopolysaccharide transport system ATP-binding protein